MPSQTKIPSDKDRCLDCRHWLMSEENQGGVCRESAVWEKVNAVHYCGRFSSRFMQQLPAIKVETVELEEYL